MRSRWVSRPSHQNDLPHASPRPARRVSKLEGIPKLSMVRFTSADVVRHPLVGRIVEAYEGPGA